MCSSDLTRGFTEADMGEIAACIDTVLAAIGTPGEAAVIEGVKGRVAALTSRYPLPYR